MSDTDLQTTGRQRVAGASKACDAVGVSSARRWYVAVVNNNTERVCGERLARSGYETYVPVSVEDVVTADGGVKSVERIVIPAVVFVRCTEMERRRRVVAMPFVKRFMTDRASQPRRGTRPVAVVSDTEIQTLRFLLYNSDSPVSIVPRSIRRGDLVRVVRGKLRGIVGRVVRHSDGTSFLLVQLDVLGCARMQIRHEDLELV